VELIKGCGFANAIQAQPAGQFQRHPGELIAI